jgi:dihydrofolate reductase
MKQEPRVILYIAASLDGFIAKSGDDLSFLNIVHKENEDYGYQAFVDSVDTVILGRKTYDWVMKHVDEFPHQDKQCFVITRQARPALGNVQFYSGDIPELIAQLKSRGGKDIFCDGGAELVNTLLKNCLIDELILSVIPVLLGNGIRLFDASNPELQLELISSEHYDTGLVQMHYRIKSS